MTRRSGSAGLPLHGGRDELLTRLACPFWLYHSAPSGGWIEISLDHNERTLNGERLRADRTRCGHTRGSAGGVTEVGKRRRGVPVVRSPISNTLFKFTSEAAATRCV